jgi:hypothetical protein
MIFEDDIEGMDHLEVIMTPGEVSSLRKDGYICQDLKAEKFRPRPVNVFIRILKKGESSAL